MVFSEVALRSGIELSEFFFKKSSNLCVVFLNNIHEEAKTLVNKTSEVTDVFCSSVQTLLSLRLSCLQFDCLRIQLSLLVQDELYLSFPSFFRILRSYMRIDLLLIEVEGV